MTFKLKMLHSEGIAAALDKAVHYRLLNEPSQAESICLDILNLEPENEKAQITLLLALTDQFDRGLNRRFKRAHDVLNRIKNPYFKAYYAGIIAERRARVHFRRGTPGSGHVAFDWFREAMHHYEKAESLSPADNDDAILRWNTCARTIMNHPELEPQPKDTYEPYLED